MSTRTASAERHEIAGADSPNAGRLDTEEVGGRYAKYVLGVLVLVYVLNFLDRQILSILAEDIKADLGVTDAQMGFLYGTAFAVFYALFGIPLGRLADTWVRKNLISLGLLVWSGMTALSGTAQGFGSLATYRIGVGVGEASASPSAYSLLSDYFAPRLRATALAIYSSGIYIGSGIGIFVGGAIVDAWSGWYPDPAAAPLHLRGWHVAFFVVALPGILMSLWVWSLREPSRGLSEGQIAPPHPHPFREAARSLSSVLPGASLIALVVGGGGTKAVAINLGAGAVLAWCAHQLIQVTGSSVQWIPLGVGTYAGFSWAQNLALTDRATFAMIFRSKAFVLSVPAFSFIAFVTYGEGFWLPSFFRRAHEVSASSAGLVIGLSAAVAGWAGVTLGGVVADKLRARYVAGRLQVGMACSVLSFPALLGTVHSQNLVAAYVFNFLYLLFSSMWIGPAASTVNDLVMPRMRATASAAYLMVVTFIGLALGPYTIGRISDRAVHAGASSADALRHAMLWGTSVLGVALVTLLLAGAFLKEDEGTRLERARALGEDVSEHAFPQTTEGPQDP